MESQSLQALIQHAIADLRAQHPRIATCHTSLEDWPEGGEPRYALQLDMRWPQHQSVVSGPARPTPEQAVHAAFEIAADALAHAHA